MRRSDSTIAPAVTIGLAIALTAASSGCAPATPPKSAPPATGVSAVAKPAPWKRDSPKDAIRSYLDWTSYGYLIGDSDVATQTMSGDEEVRVNSYLELNREQGKRIDQRLLRMTFGTPSAEGTHAIIPAVEDWQYSYVAIGTLKSLTPTYSVTYDTTYTVVMPQPGIWVVDSVDAKPRGELK